MANIETPTSGHRWVLCIEHQQCIFDNQALPEIDIAYAVQLDSYPSEQLAIEAVKRYLTAAGAVATWADVRPIEECSCCGADMDTTKRHQALSLTIETGPEDSPEILEGRYPARFCNRCAPSVESNIARAAMEARG